MGGRHLVLSFLGSASDSGSQRVLEDLRELRYLFDDIRFSFFGISIDPEDERQGRLLGSVPGIRYFWDFDLEISRRYGAVSRNGQEAGGPVDYRQHTVILDPALQVIRSIPVRPAPGAHVRKVKEVLDSIPPPPLAQPARMQAPVLVVPGVFEEGFCRELIAGYRTCGHEKPARGGLPGNFRGDWFMDSAPLQAACRERLERRVFPLVHRAFQIRPGHVERQVVTCYEPATACPARPHRQNTTPGTAHRQFAVSLDLNAGDFEGSALRFPEFGLQTYVPPLGAALVFSCALLHETTPITRGVRYAYLPFLYDRRGEELRRKNQRYLE